MGARGLTAVLTRAQAPAPTATVAVSAATAEDVRLVLVAALLGAAAVHSGVVSDHLREWPAAGQFFASLTLAEVVAAAALVRRSGRAQVLAGLVVSVLPLAVWLVSRTAGLPVGPEAGVPEAVGLSDCAACALEAVSAGAALLLLRRGLRPWLSLPAATVGLGLGAVALLTALGLAGLGGSHPAASEHGTSSVSGHAGHPAGTLAGH